MKFFKALFRLLYSWVIIILIILIFILNKDRQEFLTFWQWLKGLNWYLVFPMVISGFTVVFIYLQLQVNKLLARFTYMPSVGFILKSGKTDYLQRISKNSLDVFPNNFIKLDTRLIVRNNSKFPIYFWMEVSLEVEYKNGTKRKINNKIKYSWRMNPSGEGLNGHDSGDILCLAIMNKKLKDIDWAREEDLFNQKIIEISNIKAIITISYAPLTQKNLVFKIDSDVWNFSPELFIWIDSRGTNDDKISI